MSAIATEKGAETEPTELRGTVTALVVGGLGLVVSSQMAHPTLEGARSRWNLVLTAVGAGYFLLGARIAHCRDLPAVLRSVTGPVERHLSVTSAQSVMLMMAVPYALLATLAAGPGMSAHHAVVAVVAWLASISLAIAGGVLRAEPRWRPDRTDLLTSMGLFVVALGLRATATAAIPSTFSGDEGSAGMYATMFLDGSTDNVLGIGWFSFPALHSAIQSLAIGTVGQTVEALRITSAIVGALTVVAVYWLGRVLFGRSSGLIAAVLLAGSHYHIHMSRIGLNNIWDGLFGTVAIAALWHGWKTGRRRSFLLCGLALGMGQYFYVAIRMLPIVFLLWTAVAWVRRDRFWSRLPGLLVAGFVAVITYAPLGLLFIQSRDEFMAPFRRVSVFDNPDDQQLGSLLLAQLLRGARGFTHEPLRLLYDPGTPLLRPAMAALFLLGLLLLAWRRDLRTVLLLLPLLAVVATGAFADDAPASQRYLLAMPIVAVITALPLALTTELFENLWPRNRRLVVGFAAVVVLLVASFDVRYYFVDVDDDVYLLGGLNTLAATEIADYLQDFPEPVHRVHFFGLPRMGYYSLGTIEYLNPGIEGIDVDQPTGEPRTWETDGNTLFIFLPERIDELADVRSAHPDGAIDERRWKDSALFTVFDPSH